MKIEYEDENPTPTAMVNPPLEEIRLPGKNTKAQEELWEKIVSKTAVSAEPITEEDVALPEGEDEPPSLPDRALVSSDLREFLTSKTQQKPDPLVQQAERLEQALNQLSTPQENLTVEQIMLQKLEAVESRLARREAEDAQRREEEAYEKSMQEFKSQLKTKIEQNKENYPGLIKLGKTDAVFAELVAQANAGKDVSEDEVASAFEKRIRTEYEALKAVYEESSKENTKPSTKPKQTKSPMQKVERKFDLQDFMNKKDAQAALWESVAKRD